MMNRRYVFMMFFLLTVSPVSSEFPPDFIWGVATAALQIEGAWLEDGKAPSVWDNLAHFPGFTADGSAPEIGPDSYHLYPEDIRIMKEYKITHYRLSLSWPRIIPQGKKGKPINQKAIQHYRKMLQMLLDNGITPYVTLYHWDLPIALAIRGKGIADDHFVENFLYYADTCFKEFGDLVQNWMTFNEIWCFALLNDFKKRDIGTKPYKIAHNSLLAHAHTVDLYRKKYNQNGKGKIGIVLNSSMMYPKGKSQSDKDAAERGMIYSLDWIADPIFKGDYPEIMRTRAGNRLPSFSEEEKKLLINSVDFVGLNHYFSELCEKSYYKEHYDYWSDRDVKTSNDPHWELTDSGWPIVPQGMHDILIYIHNHWTKGTNIPIWITESGMSLHEPSLNESTNDDKRIDYHNKYINATKQAIKDGANVKAYFVWSLLDNFEWWQGYSKRFGMVRVDYSVPPVRTPKKSLRWYSDYIKSVTKDTETE